MSQAEDYAVRLSEVIGARPAGTVEEQQAAQMIEGVLADDIGLITDVEEFNCNPDFELPKTICAIATVVLGVLSLVLPLMVIPSIVLTAIAAIVFALEVVGSAPVSSALKRGVSQNVVAKYLPANASETTGVSGGRQSRKRKIIFVAHYDTGKVRFELADPIFKALPVLAWTEVGAMGAVPILLLLRLVISAEGAVLVLFNIFISVCLAISLVPIIFYILHQTAQFNVGANCNAAGVAAMMETARRLVVEFPKMADQAEMEAAVMHGEEALQEAGLVPEGTEFSYEAEAVVSDKAVAGADEGISVSAGLVESLPGAAALLEKQEEEEPVSFFKGMAEESAQSAQEPAIEGVTMREAAPIPAAEMPSAAVMSQPEEDDDPNVPDWYKKALKKANANKPTADANVSAQRSKFADALDAAAEASSNALHQMETTGATLSPAEQRLQQMRQSILGNAERSSHAVVQPTAGVDGYLASSTDAPTYESAMDTQIEEAAAAAVAEAAAEVSTQEAIAETQAASARAEAVSERAEMLAEDAEELAAEAQDLEDALAKEQAALEAQAKANRTISFIPVEVDPEEIFQQNESLKTGNIDQKAVNAQAAKKKPKAKGGRRNIALPSLSGAIDPVKKSVQAAPLADDETAKAKTRRSRQEAISVTLPSTTSEGKKKASSEEAAKENTAKASASSSASRAASAPADKTTPMNRRKSAQEIVAEAEAGAHRSARGAAHRHAHATDEDKVRAARGEVVEDTIEETSNENVSVAGSFISASDTSSFKPVGDELVAHMDEEDIYVDDADDSDYAEQFTHTGALAGPGYVDMPKGRMSRMFGRFRRNKKDEEVSLKDSIGVDDSFDARSVGAARGGWESFRGDATSTAFDDEEWNGGAFSRKSAESESTGKRRHGGEEEAANTRKRPKRGVNPFGDLPLLSEEIVVEEREAVQQFKSGVLDTEVWFVALGSELADNAGIKQFLREHKDELRGSIVIDLDGMGAGALSLIAEEGKVRRIKVSARIKRYVNKAASALGMRVESGKMNWRNSAAYMVGRNGLQTVHLVGMENGRPAHAGQPDDTFANLDLETLEKNCDYLVELLRTI